MRRVHGTHDGDRDDGVVQALAAHRAEDDLSDCAESTCSEHEQVGTRRSVEQAACWSVVDDDAFDQSVLCLEHGVDDAVESATRSRCAVVDVERGVRRRLVLLEI